MRQSIRIFVPLAAISLALSACGGGADSGGALDNGESPGGATSAPSSGAVTVVDSAFSPREVSVKAGTEISWSQTGSLPHTVTADDGSFDSSPSCPESGCMAKGDTFERTFDAPGTIPYYCKVHGQKGGGGMSGTITVTA